MQSQTLSEDFKKKHSVSEIIQRFESGQKTVYIIKDVNGQKLAMKLFRLCSARDLQEIKILNRFANVPGISKIVKVEEDAGVPVLFEEFIDAPDLHDILEEYKGNAKKIMLLMARIVEVLKPIWEAKIVHRDLKPKNIKILSNQEPVIMDFGIARDLSAESITETGDVQPMTWSYATPEQFSKEKGAISYRTDFFSLGIIAYHLYYQRHPFGISREEVENKFLSGDNTVLTDRDCELNSFFEATLAINPSVRSRTADILLATLR